MPVSLLAQMHVWSSTQLEASPFSVRPFAYQSPLPVRPLLSETFYWRGKNHPNDIERTHYNYHSVYLRDSMLGVCIYGIDFDMLHEAFRKKNTVRFRYWNKMRMGFGLMLEKNYTHPPYPKGEQYNYINAEVFISYMHIAHKSRGDQSTKARIGTWMMMLRVMPSQYYEAYLRVRPFAFSWLKFYYLKEYEIPYFGLIAEAEVNRMGYDKSKVHSSKEIYKGITLLAGCERNMNSGMLFLRFGMKVGLRNH